MEWTLTKAIRPKTKRCRLFELPPELRIAIFEYALTSDKTVVTFRLDDYQRDSLQEAVQPALTRVNRQVRLETLPVWYGCNILILHTEGAKGRDSIRWLAYNEVHLAKLKRISVWVRRVSRTTGQSSHGALGINLYRQATDDSWQVSRSWDWITVVRKPLGLEADAEALIWQARDSLGGDRRGLVTDVDDWQQLLGHLRECFPLDERNR
ncbi:hypothetical protein B0A54_15292 [Friedmanniomyces endolithicus]|uniref:F-box domain-containing protein n=1 Tax=Friedmanniomyces endolithicus TaxID=329885 RepID=A0A4U0U864_9PEZI|nr:hypothetical protein LTS09_006526 [Friedmanniomyces endolithicus]TKA31237.1 hypothetical protein B0A54_15292 [Friedmanniomyces endolithicus]